VTATSNNINLIPNPSITYTSANATGSLKFTPLADKSGIVTITVTVEDGGLDGNLSTAADNAIFSRVFDVIVNPVNDLPTLDPLSNRTIDEDAAEQTVNLAGISAGGGESQPLRVTATSNNINVIPNPSITYTSPDTTGSLKFTPLPDKSGTVTITVTVEDGGLDGNLSTASDNATFSQIFVVTVNPMNDLPTLDPLSNRTIDEDAAEQTVNLAGISAGGGESQPLRVTATSNNINVIPNPSIIYTSANTTGTLKFMPLADKSGTATITVTVEDGGLDGNLSTAGDNAIFSQTFVVTVNPVNDLPTLDPLSNRTIDEDTTEQTVNLAGISAGGGESQPLRVTATSNNINLIPNPSITYTSANATGSLKFTPLADKSGTATITVTVEDGGLDGNLSTASDNAIFSRVFEVTINPVNDLPTLDPLSNRTINEDATEETVILAGITAGGGESQPLYVTATSNQTDLIPHPTIIYTSANVTGTLKFTPLADKSGTATITVTVEDGGLDGNLATLGDNATYTRMFDVIVSAVKDIPTLDAISNRAIDEDATEQTVNLTGISAGGGESQPLRVTATSNKTDVIPNPSITYTSPDPIGTLKFTPVADKSGIVTISVTVEDGGPDENLSTAGDNAIYSRMFEVTVNPVNDLPTLDPLSNRTINEDATEQTVNLAGISAGGGESQPLRVTATSNNINVIPNPSITYTSANPTGILKFTPLADKSGAARITVTVEDGGLDGNLSTAGDNAIFSRLFDVTVNPVSDIPTLDILADLTLSEDSSAQTVSLSGISAGGGEVQNIRISATSSNPSLIPNPVVTYTSPNATGSLALTPIPNQSGSAVITVTVEDAGLDGDLSSTADNGKLNRSFTVVVNPVNDTPSFDSITDLTLSEDAPQQSISITAITAGALEAQPMSLTAISSAPWLTGSLFIDYTSPNSTGAVRFTPQPNQHGTAKLTVVLTDGGLDNNLTTTADNASVSRIIDVNILSVNDSPSAINTAREINANSQLIYSIAELLELAQDADLPLDTINPIAATYKTSLNASVEISASQGLLYDPTNLIQVKQLRTGEKLIDQATYRFRDNDGATSNLGTVQITLNGVNDPPVVVSDQFELPINRPTLLDILSNDFDYDNNLNPSSIEIISTPVGGTLHIINGQVEYRPNKTILGTDTFSYRVRDSEGSVSDVTTVALTLNEYPETVIDSKTTKRDQPLEIDVLANDFSYLSPLVPSTIQIVSSSPHGATTPTNGKVQFIPSQGFLGEASFTYTVQNTLGITSAPTSVKIVVDGSKYQNSGNRFDVNSDSNVNAIDALVIINNLNRFGVREVGSIQNEPFFLDVDGNYFVNAIDALQVINYLNSLNQGEGSEGEFDSDSFAVDRSNDSETTAEIDTFAGLLALLAEDHQRKNRTKNMLQR
jgi:VCBS repeat-containing protein